MWFVLSVCSLLVFSAIGELNVVPVVTIEQGEVMGSVAENGEYFEFYGIPYADSTSGSHRFKAPNPPPSFQDLFPATRKNIKCVRPLDGGFEGTEDCLVVNIFTNSLNATENLPVMVWINGKEFKNINEPDLYFGNIVDKDVVVVSLNFRESILGFLCLGTETAPGNAGLKDIVAGLVWIHKNIAQFGGDPDNVTLFGHGSGAAAVDLVTMSPMSAGLVHKAIAQSGTALAPWAVTRDNLEYAVLVAEALGHTITDIEELSNLFTRTSVSALMAVINDLDLTDNSLAFAPCVENEMLENVVPFLIKSPYQTIHDGIFREIPFMTGFVDSEGMIRAEEAMQGDWIEKMNTSFTEFLQSDLEFANDDEREEIAQRIKSQYFDNQTTINVEEFIEYHGDTMILVSALREVYMRTRASPSPVYVYQFSYTGTLSEPFIGPLEINKSGHREDLAYLFHNVSDDDDVDLIDLSVADILIERWTNFAKTGEPTSTTSSVQWLPFTTSYPVFIRFLHKEEMHNGTLEIEVEDPHPDSLSFWDDIYEEHFLDARGNWELSDRNEDDDDDLIEGSGDEPDEPDDGQPGSASTAVGYTFLIITLLSVLGQFHWSQLLS